MFLSSVLTVAGIVLGVCFIEWIAYKLGIFLMFLTAFLGLGILGVLCFISGLIIEGAALILIVGGIVYLYCRYKKTNGEAKRLYKEFIESKKGDQ